MEEEIKEQILTTICNVEFPCSSDCAWCEKISEALINAGYHKTELKTNGDHIRMAWSNKDDESLADRYVTYTGNPNPRSPQYYSELLNKYFFSKKQALEANLKYLKQEHKGE